jgi:hypothetical protein
MRLDAKAVRGSHRGIRLVMDLITGVAAVVMGILLVLDSFHRAK